MDFNIIDVVVGSLIILLGLKGLLRGLIKEVFGFLSIVGGVFIASRLSADAGVYIADNFLNIQNDSVKTLVGFIVLFAIFWGAFNLLGVVLSKVATISGLGIFDRIGGFLIGSFKIFFIFSIIAYGFGSVEFLKEIINKKTKNSILYPLLYNTGSYIINIEDLTSNKTIKNSVKEVKEKTKDLTKQITQEATKQVVKEAIKEINGTINNKINKEGMRN
jgi:membrane protein required for colicin V production